MVISSAPVLTVEKFQVSGRHWDRAVNDILSNYLSPLHGRVRGLEKTTWDKQLHGKKILITVEKQDTSGRPPLSPGCLKMIQTQSTVAFMSLNELILGEAPEGLKPKIYVGSMCINKIFGAIKQTVLFWKKMLPEANRSAKHISENMNIF